MQTARHAIVVWDPFIRFFHWSLVLAYLLAWATAEEWPLAHDRGGYFILGLLGLRVVWGIVGTRHARFSGFVTRPGQALPYARSLADAEPRHYVGHNPLGGWMIVALILCLVMTGVSGVMTTTGGEVWEELHEEAADLSLVLLAGHLAGVLVGSLVHRENLVAAMISGTKMRSESDV